jgi:hypothetical protein
LRATAAEEVDVTRRMVLQLVFHGLLLVVLGMVVGLPFQQAITLHWGPDAERAWRVAHTSLVGAGALYLAFAGVAHYLRLTRGAAVFITWSLVFVAYAFAFGLIVGPAVGARGLEPVGPPLHVVVFVAFAAGILLALVALAVALWGAFAALRAAGAD